jgi:hypothetical protein
MPPTISPIVENVVAVVFLRLRFVCAMCDPLIAQSLRHLFKIDKTEERFIKDDAPLLHQGLRLSHGC